jgi:hypothetical protein
MRQHLTGGKERSNESHARNTAFYRDLWNCDMRAAGDVHHCIMCEDRGEQQQLHLQLTLSLREFCYKFQIQFQFHRVSGLTPSLCEGRGQLVPLGQS